MENLKKAWHWVCVFYVWYCAAVMWAIGIISILLLMLGGSFSLRINFNSWNELFQLFK